MFYDAEMDLLEKTIWQVTPGNWLEKGKHFKTLGRWLDEPSVYHGLTSTYQINEPYDVVAQPAVPVGKSSSYRSLSGKKEITSFPSKKFSAILCSSI